MKTKIIIIGAGISGVSIAYNLAKMGQDGIVVIEKAYMTSGATGRCGAGVRQQWGTKGNCEMAQRSVKFFETAKETLGYAGDIEFMQEGYLILATTKEEVGQFQKNVELQNSIGIPSRLVSVKEALEIVPHLNPEAFLMATFCPTDGHLNPFLMTDAYYQAAKRLGVRFHFFENVLEIKSENNKIKKVVTDKNEYETDVVVNAAGGFAREIGLMAGIEIPVYSEKHEILVTEPIARIQGPMVMSFSKNIYCQQVPHGSFLIGRGDPTVPHDHDITSSWRFLDLMAKTVTEILPKIGELRVIRQWAGSYNMSPDKQPIISEAPELEGFYMACGFSGHGFMFAPMTGLLLSEIILKRKPSLDVSNYHLHRFKTNKAYETEKSVV